MSMQCEYAYCTKEATKEFFNLYHGFELHNYCDTHCKWVEEEWDKKNYPKVVKPIVALVKP